MIPKIIHLCWFSGEEYPPFIKRCIDTWKEFLPDYKIKVWDSNSFDFDSVPFVREAYKARKWAFVADYIRLYALYTEGGIYMDSDVRVFRNFDKFLDCNFFTSHEINPGVYNEVEARKLDSEGRNTTDESVKGFGVQAAIMGASAGLPFLKNCLDFYNQQTFDVNKTCDLVIGLYITKQMEKYGYRYVDEEQHLADDMRIYKSDIFVGNALMLSKDSYAIHLCNGSWTEHSSGLGYKIRNYYPFFYPLWRLGEKIVNKIGRCCK